MWRPVTSSTNAAIKHLVKLASSPRLRKTTGTCVVPGTTLVSELLLHGGDSPGAAPAHSSPQLRSVVASRDSLPLQLRHQLEAVAQRATGSDRISLFDVAGDAAVVLRRVSMLESAGEGTATVAAEFDIPPQVEYEPPLDKCRTTTIPSAPYRNVDDVINAAAFSEPSAGDGSDAPCRRRRRRVVVLDGVSDPGNVGAILRSALALGFDTALLLEGCCDPFNPKAIRAARAAQWGMRRLVVNSSWSAVSDLTDKLNARLVVADSNVQSSPQQGSSRSSSSSSSSSLEPHRAGGVQQPFPSDQSVVLAVGNESRGLSLAEDSALACRAERIQVVYWRMHFDKTIGKRVTELFNLNSCVSLRASSRVWTFLCFLWCTQVPMQNGVESLNVAVAASLLMHRLSL